MNECSLFEEVGSPVQVSGLAARQLARVYFSLLKFWESAGGAALCNCDKGCACRDAIMYSKEPSSQREGVNRGSLDAELDSPVQTQDWPLGN